MLRPGFEPNTTNRSHKYYRFIKFARSCVLWNQRVNCYICKNPPQVSFLSNMNSAYILVFCSLEIGFNIQIPFLSSSELKFLYAFVTSLIRKICPSQFILLDLVTLILFLQEHKLRLLLYVQFSC